MFVREAENEYGTPVTVHRCDECGEEFTVTPAVPKEKREEWNGCMAESCASYEPTRDAELYFSLGMTVRSMSPRQEAWNRVNQLIDDGLSDTPEYREAWGEWVRLSLGDKGERGA